jgi:BTB/POZ domain-containing protein 9
LPGINVASNEYKPKLLTGNRLALANLFTENEVLNRTAGYFYLSNQDTNGYVIELNGNYYINHMRIRILDLDLRNYYYHVEVSVDGKEWHKVIDHSQLPCRSWQYLYFPSRIMRYIRIVGSKLSDDINLCLISFKAFYIENSFI